jgi:hypothetical protein
VLYVARVAIVAAIYFMNSENSNIAGLSLFLLQMLGSFHFYLHGIVMNSFEDSRFEGMSVTMMASMSNLGRNSSLHLSLIGDFGFRTCVLYSFGYTVLTMVAIKPFHMWIKRGK